MQHSRRSKPPARNWGSSDEQHRQWDRKCAAHSHHRRQWAIGDGAGGGAGRALRHRQRGDQRHGAQGAPPADPPRNARRDRSRAVARDHRAPRHHADLSPGGGALGSGGAIAHVGLAAQHERPAERAGGRAPAQHRAHLLAEFDCRVRAHYAARQHAAEHDHGAQDGLRHLQAGGRGLVPLVLRAPRYRRAQPALSGADLVQDRAGRRYD